MRLALAVGYILAAFAVDLSADDDAPTIPTLPATVESMPARIKPPRERDSSAISSTGSLPRPGSAPRTQTASLAELQVTNQTRQALAFYGAYSARATLSQLPRRSPIQSAPRQPIAQQPKPSLALDTDTLSPYLHLDREETAEDMPNYFTFVRPQLQQREANLSQYRELQRMQRQLNAVSATVVAPQFGNTLAPRTSTPARFMDTAQFYGGWRR